jgi:hypothetical protein
MTSFGKGLRALALAVLCACASAVGAQQPMEATTGGGDKVLLHPDGRWEYADPKKRAESPPRPTTAAAPPAAQPTQGGLFGIGRTILPGDPEYNRGSLSGKGR